MATPSSNFPKCVSVKGLYDDSQGFRIVFSDNDSPNEFNVIFDNYIAYRNSDEGARLKSHALFPNNSREWCLFKTNQSEFIDWLVQKLPEYIQPMK